MNEARLTIWNDDACKRVHEATLEVLATTGIEVRYAPAAEIFAKAGARVDGTRVRIPAELVEAAIKSAPRDWTIKPRGGDTEPLVLDAGHSYCGTGSDVLYVCDPDTRERRRVRKADVEGMAALCEKLPNIDFVMSMGLPEDAPQAIDDLAQVDAMVRGTRKPLLVAPRDGHILAKMKEMTALAGEQDSFGIYAMPVPPLLFDEDGASKVIACAELDVPLIWAPAPNAGTTAPASIVAVIVVANAEVLAGLVLSQAVKPGAPFVWGAGVGAMNMRTMVDVYSSANVLPGPPGPDGPRALVRPAELRLRRPHRLQVPRRPVERRGGAHRHPRQALSRDASARRRLPRERPAEQLRVHPARRPSGRLGQGVHGRARRSTTRRSRWTRSTPWGRAAITWPGRTRASTSGRSGRATSSTRRGTTTGRRTAARRCSTGSRRGSRSCAPSRAPSSSTPKPRPGSTACSPRWRRTVRGRDRGDASAGLGRCAIPPTGGTPARPPRQTARAMR